MYLVAADLEPREYSIVDKVLFSGFCLSVILLTAAYILLVIQNNRTYTDIIIVGLGWLLTSLIVGQTLELNNLGMLYFVYITIGYTSIYWMNYMLIQYCTRKMSHKWIIYITSVTTIGLGIGSILMSNIDDSALVVLVLVLIYSLLELINIIKMDNNDNRRLLLNYWIMKVIVEFLIIRGMWRLKYKPE